MKKILVFPCGSEIGLEIHRSLKYSKDFTLYGGSSVNDHGQYVYDNYIANLPPVENEDFITAINSVIKKHKIDFVFPAHDSVVLKLAQEVENIEAEIITSPLTTCEVSRSKRKTYEVFKGIVSTPKIFDEEASLHFPVFLKPDVGQGSKGVLKAESSIEVEQALRKNPGLMVLEYLPGKEYTVDCFTNTEGDLMFVQARERIRVTNGISVNSRPIEASVFNEIAQKINSNLRFRGVWFFQVKENYNKELVLMEIAPRVAGTMALCRMQGVNLPLLSLYEFMGIKTSILKNNFKIEIDRALHSRYKLDIQYEKVFVDFDDAIILNGKVNELMIAFLYKCLNQGKKCILITKHVKAVKETLKEHRISEDIFDEIISIKREEEKSAHITTNSIFIDDSFSERQKVFEKLAIPVFDISEAVELIE